MSFKIPEVNMFQQPVQQIGAVGGRQAQPAGGGGINRGGQTSFEADMANFRNYLPQNNGTGDLQPANNAKFNLMA